VTQTRLTRRAGRASDSALSALNISMATSTLSDSVLALALPDRK